MGTTQRIIDGRRADVRRFASSLLDAVTPPACVLCGGGIAGHSVLCAECEPEVFPDRNTCRRCGAIQGPNLPEVASCPKCAGESFAFDAAVALGHYDGRLRPAVLRAKARGGRTLATHLAGRLLDLRESFLEAENAAVVTAVPRHWRRRAMTEHDPADAVGRVVAGRLGLPFRPRILVQHRPAAKQAYATRTARKAALKDHFRIGRHVGDLDDATVILCDDVLTTGTTASRCARVLKRAGAGRVVVAVLARSVA